MASRLEEIREIEQLKYRYLRCIDTKDWEGLAETFTEDASTGYGGGAQAFRGRDAIMAFMRAGLERMDIVSLHQVHHPEIELTSATTAKGRWYLEDYVINSGPASEYMPGQSVLRGAALYSDEYVKVDGAWKIAFTGYERTFEQVTPRPPDAVLTTRWDAV